MQYVCEAHDHAFVDQAVPLDVLWDANSGSSGSYFSYPSTYRYGPHGYAYYQELQFKPVVSGFVSRILLES
jgi:hypothetical protein